VIEAGEEVGCAATHDGNGGRYETLQKRVRVCGRSDEGVVDGTMAAWTRRSKSCGRRLKLVLQRRWR